MEEEKEDVKISFFKKIWYSIAKVKKYDDMAKEGLWVAIKYFLILMAILALILSLAATYIQSGYINESISFLEEKLPEMTLKDNELSLEGTEAVILDEDKFIDYFGCIVIINPYLEEQEAINEYYEFATTKNKCIVFVKNECIQISYDYVKYVQNENGEVLNAKEHGVDTYSYEELVSKYMNNTESEYHKQDLINYIKTNTSYTYYICGYFISYLLILLAIYAFYIIIVSISCIIISKILKLNESFKILATKTIYATTLSSIIYVIYLLISYFAKFTIPYFDIISMLAIYIYLGIIFNKMKKEAK